MFFVYVLEDEEKNLYTGYSVDLKRRLAEHNQGKNTSTKGSVWRCVYYEACLSQTDAIRREKYLKTTQGKRMLKRRLKDYLYNRK